MVSLINNLLSSALEIPKGLGVWEDIIRWFYSFIGDYGFTIIIIALILKILLLPLDFFQRKATAKMQANQARLQPQIAKLQEKYKDDKNTLNQKTMELYKRENVGMFGSCGIMLLYMVINVFVFMTLFFGMNNIAKNATIEQYNALKAEYQSVQETDYATEEEFNLARNQAVLDKYNEIKTSWLWIENIWRPDRTVNPVATFEDYASVAGIKKDSADYEAQKAEYENIMEPLRKSVDSHNGYYILIILSAGITFLSVWLSNHIIKKKNKDKKPVDQGRIVSAKGEREKPDNKPNTAVAQKVMMVILPIIMVLITWGYSAAFAIYIVTTSAFNALSSYVFSVIFNKKYDNFQGDNKPKNNIKKPEYVRQ